MRKRMVVVLLFAFVLMISSFDNVSAAAEDETRGIFDRIWDFFKGLFGWGDEGDFVDTDDELDSLSRDLGGGDDGDVRDDGDDGLPVPDVSVEIVFSGPTEIAINGTATYVGSVTGADSCTLYGISLDDCDSFVRDFIFIIPGTYNMTLTAGGESETIVLVVLGEEIVPEVNASVEILFYGTTEVGVNEIARYRGRVLGTDSCTLNGASLDDCGSFVRDLTFSAPGTYNITLAAGDKTKTIELVVGEGVVEDPPVVSEDPPVVGTSGFNCTDLRIKAAKVAQYPSYYNWRDLGTICVERCVEGQTWGPVNGDAGATEWDYECGPDVPGAGCSVNTYGDGPLGSTMVPIGTIRHYMMYQATNDVGRPNIHYYTEYECIADDTWSEDNVLPGHSVVIDSDDNAPFEGYFPERPYDYLYVYDFVRLDIDWANWDNDN